MDGETKGFDEGKPFVAMTVIDFSFAIVNNLLKKVIDQGMNHLVLITYRLTISTIFLVPISYFWERNCRPKLTVRILCYLFLSAIVGSSITQYFFLLGIQYTSATFACAFLSTWIEKVDLKRSSGKAKVIGTIVCLCGALTLTLYKGVPLFDHSNSTTSHVTIIDHGLKLSSSKIKERWTIESVCLVAGTLLWSSWFLVQSFITKIYLCQYSSTTIMNFFGATQSAILGLCTSRNLSVWILRGKDQVFTVMFAGMIARIRVRLCGDVMVCEEKGAYFYCSIQPHVQIMAYLSSAAICKPFVTT